MVGTDRTAIVTPSITVGVLPIPMLPIYSQYLVRCVVDTHLQLPDMFELWFNDENGDIVESAGLSIGTQIEIKAGKATDMTGTSLIIGEITSIEAICQEAVVTTVVRGYAKEHRLQRAQRTRTYVNMSDSDIASKVAGDAGLKIGTVESTSGVHDHIAQVAQTDWDFLTQRAREIGYETGVSGGEFYFRPASTGSDSGGGGLLDAAASMLGLGGTLKFKDNLHVFLPRLSAANLTPDVEVRVWDGMTGEVAVGTAPAASGTATIDGQDPATLANSFTDGLLPTPPVPPSPPAIPGLPKISLGSNPSNTAFVVVNRPLATGTNATRAAEEAAKSLADHVASTFAEAEGDCEGDPTIQAGSTVTIEGVPKQFAGKWVISNAKHIFDPLEGGYHIRFYVSGRQDRSTLSLTSGKAARGDNGFNGVVCAVVTNAQDPEKLGRVKVSMPWLSPQYESDWARVVQFGAGARSGGFIVPTVGDEVLIGFEFGDPRRPYVLGGLINQNSDFGHLSTAVDGSGKVIERGFATPAGSRLLFTDDLSGPPGTAPPTKAEIVLGSKDDKIGLKIDQANGTVSLTCDPAPPNSSSANGSLTIECPGLGAITIKAGAGGLKLETDGELSLSGKQGVKIESMANTVIKGLQVQLN